MGYNFIGHLKKGGCAMRPLEIRSRVGADGVLNISIPLGSSEANREVRVTVEAAGASDVPSSDTKNEWQQFIESMAGCIIDSTFQRQEQGECASRAEMFP
jgi:hypothetical protein